MPLHYSKHAFALVAFAAGVGLAGSSFAEGLYFLGSPNPMSLGAGTPTESDADLVRLGRTGLRLPMASNTEFKGRLGYQLTPNFAVEGGYVDLGTQSYNTSLAGGLKGLDTKSSGMNVSALGIMPVNYQLSVFGKVGYTSGSLRGIDNLGGTSVSISQDKNSLGMGLGGIYQITPSIGLRAEWERPYSDVNLLTFGLQARF